MSIIPKFFLDAVVSLGVKNGDKAFWIATGFIVGRKEKENPELSTFYIITNKHVVEDKSELLIRFNSQDSQMVKDYILPLKENEINQYSEHPIKEIDIIAKQIIPQVLIVDKSKWSAFDLDDLSLTLEQMRDTGVDEGAYIYLLGFPMNLVGDFNNSPICRSGCISRISDSFTQRQKSNYFLVDAQAFPGNSGGPVINRPELVSIQGTTHNTNANLIGILSAYIPYRDVLISKQTKQETMILSENSGLTIVYPVDKIKEVVELEYQRINDLIKRNKLR